MTREPMTLQLYRQNKHVAPSVARDVWDLIQGATLLFIILWCVVLVMA